MKQILLSTVAVAVMGVASAGAQDNSFRRVRELEVGDPNLKPVLFAAVDHVFRAKDGPPIGFSGIYLKRRLEPSLTAEVQTRLNTRGVARIDTPAGCESLPSRSGPTPPAGKDKNGNPLKPAAVGVTKEPSAAICDRGFEASYSFHMVRVSGDSAYVETRIEGVGRSSTQCLSLVVGPEGGWQAIGLKRSKIGKCGD